MSNLLCVVALHLVLSQTDAADRRLALEFELPPRSGRLTPVGDELEGAGVRMRMATFETQQSPDDVLEFYAARFARAGMFPGTFPGPQSDERVFTAVDATRKLQKLVWVRPRGTGSSVTVAIAPLSRTTAAVQPTPLPVNLPPECRTTSDTGARDGKVWTRVVTLTCSRTPSDIEQVTKEGMLRAGFHRDAKATAKDPGTTAWQKAAQQWTVRSVPLSARETGVVLVSQSANPVP